jgi:hypothetical protein
MPITLESKARQMQVFNLPHDIYCAVAGHCRCQEQLVTTVVEDPQTGERTPRSVVRRIPASLTLLAGARAQNLEEAVLKVAEIRTAIERGAIRVFTEPTAMAGTAAGPQDRAREATQPARRTNPRSA